MIVGPLSTLSNWVDEFKRWLPSINVILYHGSKDERHTLRKSMPLGELSNMPGRLGMSYWSLLLRLTLSLCTSLSEALRAAVADG